MARNGPECLRYRSAYRGFIAVPFKPINPGDAHLTA